VIINIMLEGLSQHFNRLLRHTGRLAGPGGSSMESHSGNSRNILEQIRNFPLFHLLPPNSK
jgi:hypothetical protein